MERAFALNSNNIFILMFHALWLNYMARNSEALAAIDAAHRRDPFALDWFWDVRAMTQTGAGLYVEALASWKRMKQMPPWGHAYMAICHVGLNQLSEARAAAAKYVHHDARGYCRRFSRNQTRIRTPPSSRASAPPSSPPAYQRERATRHRLVIPQPLGTASFANSLRHRAGIAPPAAACRCNQAPSACSGYRLRTATAETSRARLHRPPAHPAPRRGIAAAS